MRREKLTPRPGWQQKVEQLGFDFYNLDGKAYWTEQACYAFNPDQIDEVEAATGELHGLCLKAVEYVVANKLWERMRIPPAWGDYITTVWRRADPTIAGRFVQCRHADRALRGRGRAMVLAEGCQARRRPVQLHP
jgi:glutathionylspermidine synthase